MQKENILEAVKAARKALDDKFGQDIVTLDISGISNLSDYFIIASGKNSSQIKAMADEVCRAAEGSGLALKHTEGSYSSPWFLLDFGDLIVHIFFQDDRDFYGLERIWADAKELDKADIS